MFSTDKEPVFYTALSANGAEILYRETIISNKSMFSAFSFSTLCVTYVLHGQCTWQIGNEVYHVTEGDFIFLNNLESRIIQNVSENEGFHIATCSFPSTALSILNQCLRVFYSRTSDFSHVLRGSFKEIEKLKQLFEDIKMEMVLNLSQQNDLLYGYIIQLTALSARIYDIYFEGMIQKQFNVGISSVAETIALSAAYINNHICETLTVSQLAKQANMSVSYFSEMFHKYTMVSVNKYLTSCRVNHVAFLISVGNCNIMEAAYKCGFQSPSGFYKAFKRITGYSPVEFKKLKTI